MCAWMAYIHNESGQGYNLVSRPDWMCTPEVRRVRRTKWWRVELNGPWGRPTREGLLSNPGLPLIFLTQRVCWLGRYTSCRGWSGFSLMEAISPPDLP